ncbi:MAG: class I SAM-dependent methyltransferase [Acidimicrobiales bacterium]
MDQRGALSSEPTTSSQPGSRDWEDDDVARQWTAGDRLEPLLQLPRQMAASLLGAGEPEVRRVVDIGSGPGAFLEAVLRRCPEAHGVWTDVSEAMRTMAADRLGDLAGRIEYRLLDAAHIAEVGGPGTVDAVVTSRVSHHLQPSALRSFYADARRLLPAGGWIANLDHVSLDQPWAGRLAAARAELIPPNPSPHRHQRPLPALEDHLGALAACGDLDVVVPWRAFATVLILARRTR